MAKKGQNFSELEKRVASMELTILELQQKNTALETKVAKLEDRVAVAENVSSKLAFEVDRLDQYHRRCNIVIKDTFLPEEESVDAVKNMVSKLINQELKLPEMSKDIDKAHRIGKVQTRNGKKEQDIIVRFKTHSSRYSVYQDRKKAKNVRIFRILERTEWIFLKKHPIWTSEHTWGLKPSFNRAVPAKTVVLILVNS